MTAIPQRHRQTDGRMDGQLALAKPRSATLRAVKIGQRVSKLQNNKKLSFCLKTARRESLQKIAVQFLIYWTLRWQPRLKWPSNVLQGHQKWHQSKDRSSVWLPISNLVTLPYHTPFMRNLMGNSLMTLK